MIYLLRLVTGEWALGKKVTNEDEFIDVYFVNATPGAEPGEIVKEMGSLWGPWAALGGNKTENRVKQLRGIHVIYKKEAEEGLKQLYVEHDSSIKVVQSLPPTLN